VQPTAQAVGDANIRMSSPSGGERKKRGPQPKPRAAGGGARATKRVQVKSSGQECPLYTSSGNAKGFNHSITKSLNDSIR
jgi:hypothetical protein